MSVWLHVTSQNKPLVPDQVLQKVEPNSVLTDNGGKVPIESMQKWGYTLTPVRLVPLAESEGLIWSDKKIDRYVGGLDELQSSQMTRAMKYVRDEYEMERKNKIFIPVHLRGCVLSTIQKSKEFLVEMVRNLEEKLPEKERLLPGVATEIEGWKAEIAEYQEIIRAIIGDEQHV